MAEAHIFNSTELYPTKSLHLWGVPQGSPLLPLLYGIYTITDLLDITRSREDAISLGFIDDIVYGIEGYSDRGNVQKLRNILEKAEEWRRRHGVQFETSKYVLVHFTRNSRQATKATFNLDQVLSWQNDETIVFNKKTKYYVNWLSVYGEWETFVYSTRSPKLLVAHFTWRVL